MTRGMDEAAFRGFIHARYGALSRTAYLLTGDWHLAEDLVQTALYKAARVWSRVDGNPAPMPAASSTTRTSRGGGDAEWSRCRPNILRGPRPPAPKREFRCLAANLASARRKLSVVGADQGQV
jgi:hypothetical protein